MINVDVSYYTDVYGGESPEEAESCLKRAADIIDSIILIEPKGDMQISAYKWAVCAQAEFIVERGGNASINSAAGISSLSLGKFSVSTGGSGSDNSCAEKISDIAVMHLDKAGLLYRGF